MEKEHIFSDNMDKLEGSNIINMQIFEEMINKTGV